MIEIENINKKYSTTRLLTREKPVLEHKPEYKLTPMLFLPDNPDRKVERGLRTKGYFKKSYENKPLISIVTVVYNGEKHLEQTIKSVIEQDYDNVEYIIIDGGSTDSTLEIIKNYEYAIDYWVSEPDEGIYDAMNKGASLCTGDYIAFLNADDWYPMAVISSIGEVAKEINPNYIYGDMDLYNKNSFIRKRRPFHYKYGTPIGHQALFVKTSIMKKIPFDIQYKIASDYDFMIKLIKSNCSSVRVEKSLANFRLEGVSSQINLMPEYFQIYKKHFGLFAAIKFYFRNSKHPIISTTVQYLLKIKKWHIGENKNA